MNREAKNEVKLRYEAAKAKVMKLGLKAFEDPSNPLPLRIGVSEDLSKFVGEEVTSDFLKLWTSRREYKLRLIRGKPRYTLQGEPDGLVGDENIKPNPRTVVKRTNKIKTPIGHMKSKIKHAKYVINKRKRNGLNTQAAERKLKSLLEKREEIRAALDT